MQVTVTFSNSGGLVGRSILIGQCADYIAVASKAEPVGFITTVQLGCSSKILRRCYHCLLSWYCWGCNVQYNFVKDTTNKSSDTPAPTKLYISKGNTWSHDVIQTCVIQNTTSYQTKVEAPDAKFHIVNSLP